MSAWWLHMVTLIFLRGLCGYVWVNILTLFPLMASIQGRNEYCPTCQTRTLYSQTDCNTEVHTMVNANLIVCLLSYTIPLLSKQCPYTVDIVHKMINIKLLYLFCTLRNRWIKSWTIQYGYHFFKCIIQLINLLKIYRCEMGHHLLGTSMPRNL